MFGVGALMIIMAAATAIFFGVATTFGVALARLLPGSLASLQGFVVRLGGTNLWYNVIYPVMELPCWLPVLAIGALFVLIGVLRRV